MVLKMSKTGKEKTTRTTLVNLRTYKGSDYVLIDRRTLYGNHQFKIGQYNFYLKRKLTREDAVDLFRAQFKNRIKNYPKYRAKVEKLRGKKIACWCTPLACHGDIYIEYFEGE